MPPLTGSGGGSIENGDGAEIRVVLARFEAKLDVALAQHGAKIDQHDAELRNLREERKEQHAKIDARADEHDRRLLELERKPTISPKALWAALASAIGAFAALSPLIERLYR